MEAKHLEILQKVAEQYGNGTVHITIRQGFEISGIDMINIPEINKMIQPVIEGLEINQVNPDRKTLQQAQGMYQHALEIRYVLLEIMIRLLLCIG